MLCDETTSVGKVECQAVSKGLARGLQNACEERALDRKERIIQIR